jgi:hypothetical protein
MAGFTITSPTPAITLDEHWSGKVGFTVANQTGRSVRARASVSPFEPALAGWFRIEGEAERLLSLGGSTEYTVRIAVPPPAEPGPRSFRLDIVSADLSDEEWAHGPPVGFEIPRDKPPPPPAYLETVAGAVVGAFVGIVLGIVAGAAVVSAAGTSVRGSPVLTPLFGGELLAGVAFGGAIGIFGALSWRQNLEPAPLRTAAVYIAIALVLTTALELLLELAIPNRAAPTRSVAVATPSPPFDVLIFVVALIAAALAALAARAVTRWQVLGRI